MFVKCSKTGGWLRPLLFGGGLDGPGP